MDDVTGPYVCTLQGDEAQRRLPQMRALIDRLRRRERVDDRLVLMFDDDGYTLGVVADFIRDESQCCSFFAFEVHRHDGHILVALTAPAQAGHTLDAVEESFDPDLGDDGLTRYHIDALPRVIADHASDSRRGSQGMQPPRRRVR